MSERTIAALYVQAGGAYYDLPGVEPWGLPDRDAREYRGPYPVVAHPPCARWCRMAKLIQSRYPDDPRYAVGADDGCFAAALASVRRWGGVLEHPAFTLAWAAHDLTTPQSGGGWYVADAQGGWACHVEQGQYGLGARKATWLYAHGVPRLPSLRWGSTPDDMIWARVSDLGNRGPNKYERYLGGKSASATPPEFRDILIAMARSAREDDDE